MPAKKKSRSRIRFGFREFILLCIGFSLPFSLYVFYLDREVVRQFEGKRFSLPARVYARPLELHSGKTLRPNELLSELRRLNYKKVSTPVNAGEYSVSSRALELVTRPFSFWDGQQDSVHVSIQLSKNSIEKIHTLDTHEVIHLLRLDPIAIGGIYPNKGEDRELVRLNQVPKHLVHALIAIEDKRFYQHYGIDPKAIVRALTTIFSGKRIQGGSTITQQLIKNFFLTQERTIQRKVKEMIMAVLLELHYEKNDILETYINEVYFGQDKNRAIHGFGLASQFYFARNIQQLQAHQSALLVGMLKGPAYYNPRKHSERAKARRNIVLKAMREQNYISQKKFQQASNKSIEIRALPNRGQSLYPAFMDLVIEQLRRDYREEDLRSEGLRIFTTLDPFEQEAAENSLKNQLKQLEKNKGLKQGNIEGAIVLTDILNGEVKALVGGRRTGYQGFNRALKASRQIGSLIKPAIYLSALSHSTQYHLTSELDDSPFTWQENGIEDWMPKNYDREFHGNVPLWLALAKSYNVAAARLGTELGVEKIMAMTQRLGIQKSLPNYASGLLGTVHLTPYEVTQMYHTIASGGFLTPFRAIREVTSMNGDALNRYDIHVKQAIEAKTNYLLIKALQQVPLHGTATGLKQYLSTKLNVAGKTGTTDDLRDSWFAGFTGDKLAVVWLGNDKNQPIKLTGASGALKVWGDMMSKLSPQALQPATPPGIKYAAVDNSTGFLAVKDCTSTFELPFEEHSLPNQEDYCSGKKKGKIKSWFKRLFGKN